MSARVGSVRGDGSQQRLALGADDLESGLTDTTLTGIRSTTTPSTSSPCVVAATWPPTGIASPYYLDNSVCIIHGDCREVMPTVGAVDAIVTDPPYGVNLGEHGAAT